jgi:hypothetical protein
MIMKGGTPGYLRDGRVYEGGIFGGDLEEAVRGNPEAEEHARSFHNGMLGGFLSTIAGGAGMVGGLLLVASGSNSNGPDDTTKQTIGGSIAVGGLAAYVLGLVLITTAQPHMFDAINIYNDGVDARYAPPAYAPVPYAPGPYGPPRPYPPPPPVLPPGPGAQPLPPPAAPPAPAPK